MLGIGSEKLSLLFVLQKQQSFLARLQFLQFLVLGLKSTLHALALLIPVYHKFYSALDFTVILSYCFGTAHFLSNGWFVIALNVEFACILMCRFGRIVIVRNMVVFRWWRSILLCLLIVLCDCRLLLFCFGTEILFWLLLAFLPLFTFMNIDNILLPLLFAPPLRQKLLRWDLLSRLDLFLAHYRPTIIIHFDFGFRIDFNRFFIDRYNLRHFLCHFLPLRRT